MLRLISVTLPVFLLIGCATTNLSSFRAPEFADASYRRIMISVPFADFGTRIEAETIFLKACSWYSNWRDITCLSYIQVLPPTQEYTAEEIAKALSDQHIDALMVIRMTNAYSTQAYVPEFTTTSGRATASGNTMSYSGQSFSYGGFSVSKPTVQFEIKLFDAASSKVAWIGGSTTRGNANAGFDTLLRSLANSALQRLDQDGLIKKKSAFVPSRP